ncbi:NAD(P)-dependent oxidoreductase [Microbacterium hydrocarbonoxydans]|uniref:NAD(P)-dependent oxidoreductase n=1 Tax=Microbacterium hydrocarbonoxydans TaxID=273678 RepID=UPI0007BBC4D8|nr:NAD(P)-dependent oxidoreductase [Microbacterium hydrocarbonoxydans]GAT71949.1 D-isomer specific 2-hydroxyacid dehydrogenase family protein [Microbacterium sp. HM58-2]
MKILIPNTIELSLRSDAEVVVYDVAADIPAEHRDAEVLVVWQNPAPQLARAAQHLTAPRLVQTLAAGPDVVVAAGFAPEVPICSGRSLHDGPVAEHALALVLGAVRRLDLLRDAQHERRWDRDFVAAQVAPDTRAQYTLAGARVTIWGFGSIAARLAPMLRLLGAEVRGIARSAGIRSGVEVAAEADAGEVLAGTDVLVSLVPATAETTDLFDASVFGMLKPAAVFVNVGRGATVDEDALLEALATGQLRTAALDVMKAEPLPEDSPLWTTPGLVLTPHVAGNRPVGGADLVDANVARLLAGDPLVNEVRR